MLAYPSLTDHLPVRNDLHYTLDKLSFFAITCSKRSLEDMIAELDSENTKWQAMPARRRSNYIRTFYVSVTFVLVGLNQLLILARHGPILFCGI